MMSKTEVVPWHGMREAPIVLVTGSESYLADRVFRELRDRVRIAQPELEVTDVDAAYYAVGTLLDVASPSLFGEPRMIRIANGESGGDDFVADIQSYLDVIADDVIVIVRHGGGNRGKKLLDTLRAHPTTLEVECAEIKKEADRAQFASAEFNRLGVKADRAAVGALVEAFAGDLAELAAACEQIASDALGKSITKEFVDTYYEGREEVTSFAVADMAIDGNRAEALRLLRHAIQSGVDPVPLIAAFAAKLRQLAKVGGYTGSPSNAAKDLGMPPWMIDKSRSALRKWTGPTLGRAILVVAEADSMVKGAGRDPEFAVERMVDRVASRS
ncbi:MAG: DNA polymerase III subunit delta [Actinobacteria bacterium]|nr:DNA polymerase III subunit delta [Actinomycetota bacterium]